MRKGRDFQAVLGNLTLKRSKKIMKDLRQRNKRLLGQFMMGPAEVGRA